MNIENIVKVIKKVTTEKYPKQTEVAKFCEKIIKWEAENSAFEVPRYKEPYRRFVKECLKIKNTK